VDKAVETRETCFPVSHPGRITLFSGARTGDGASYPTPVGVSNIVEVNRNMSITAVCKTGAAQGKRVAPPKPEHCGHG